MYRAEDHWPAPHRGLLFASLTAAALACAGLLWAWWSLPAGDAAAPVAAMPLWAGLGMMAAMATATGCGLWWLVQRKLARRSAVDVSLPPQRLLTLLDVWFWQTDREHRLVRWRPPAGAAADTWAEAVPLGRPLWEVLEPAPADAGTGLRQRLQGEAALTDLRVVGRRTDGSVAHWLLRSQPRLDAAGGFEGHDGTLRLLDSSIRADTPGGEGDAREQESFSYTVSHDLRTPIRVVEGFTKILKEDYGRVLDRIGNDHLDRVLGAAARMNNMIDALLALSRLSAQPLAVQPVDLSLLAGYVLEDLHRQHPERAVETRIAPQLQVHGDPVLLRVALENLLGNAWKYSAKREAARIEFGAETGHAAGEAPSRTVYFVRDNGAGFDMRFADRLFDVFQRLHSANDFPGTGVGLATVRRIVRRHGGEIWADSEVERGATFYFTLS